MRRRGPIPEKTPLNEGRTTELHVLSLPAVQAGGRSVSQDMGAGPLVALFDPCEGTTDHGR